jgi:hypothetical protein
MKGGNLGNKENHPITGLDMILILLEGQFGS